MAGENRQRMIQAGLSLPSWNRENRAYDEVAFPVIAASRHGACRSPRVAAFRPQFEWSRGCIFMHPSQSKLRRVLVFFYSRPPVRITNSDCREKAERGKFAGKGGIKK